MGKQRLNGELIMRLGFYLTTAISSAAISLSLLAVPAQANPTLPGLTNLNFLSYSGSAPKNYFNNVNPTRLDRRLRPYFH
jgi:hypothetical protein